MTKVDPDVADDVPWSDNITPYDEQHFVTYLRPLDANAELDLSNRVVVEPDGKADALPSPRPRQRQRQRPAVF